MGTSEVYASEPLSLPTDESLSELQPEAVLAQPVAELLTADTALTSPAPCSKTL